ncbi:MAG TPA: DUF2341 domain-containing protein [Gammaproteobacteria bacterium]|nr:DUF2341 domain-containing protein [Gammaproteobacteria bacterium]
MSWSQILQNLSNGWSQRDPAPSGFHFERLEPRILLSADFLPGLVDHDLSNQDQPLDYSPDLQPVLAFLSSPGEKLEVQNSFSDFPHSLRLGLLDENQPAEWNDVRTTSDLFEDLSYLLSSDAKDITSRVEIIIVDPATSDYQQLIDGVRSGSDNTIYEIYVLDSDSDGIQQISDILQDHATVDAVHIISHGEDGKVFLGNAELNSGNLSEYASGLIAWQQTLDIDADILLYGCNLGATNSGVLFLDELARLTGADVAASDDDTGAQALNGDWDLEVHTGSIETSSALSLTTQQQWQHLLAVPVALPDDYTVNQNTALESNDSWFDNNWSYRSALAFDNSAQTEDLTDFPVLIILDATRIDYLHTENNGQDLRFVDGNGTVLAHEIESWDESGTSYVWVHVPKIDSGSSTDFIWMYFGNSGVADGQNGAGVWNSSHKGVWHLNETSGPHDDSTNNPSGHDIDQFGGVNQSATGKISGADNFDGTNDYLWGLGPEDQDLQITGDVTLEAWVYIDTLPSSGYASIIEFAGGGESEGKNYLYSMLLMPDGDINLGHEYSDGSNQFYDMGVSLNSGQWYQLTAVRDSVAKEWHLYVDGSLTATESYNFAATGGSGSHLWVGFDSVYLDGTIDEIRISDTVRSAAWISAQHAAMSGSFVTYGYEQSVAGVLGNDFDADGDALTAVLVTGPSNSSSFSFNVDDGSFSYTPASDFIGTDSFTYKANDGTDSNVATVTINVTPTPANTMALPDAYTVNKNTLLDSNDTWFDSGWSYRNSLAFDNSAQTENLTDFPVLIILDSTRVDYSNTQNNGEDLRFVDGNGTVLAHQIESWNETGTSYVWVQIPQIDAGSGTDFIWMYYGNVGAADGQNVANVWDVPYKAVWHLDETSGSHSDSTSNNYTAIQNGGVNLSATGKIGGADEFDGGNDRLKVNGVDTALQIKGDLTLEAWVKIASHPISGTAGIVKFAGNGDTEATNYLYTMRLLPGGDINLGHESGNGTKDFHDMGVSLNTDEWYKLTAVRDTTAKEWHLYINGTLAATESYAAQATGGIDGTLKIALDSGNFEGIIDEVRVSDTARSADWISVQYAAATDSLITYGFKQTIAGVLGNDFDADGDSLNAVLASGPSNAASFSLNTDGSFTYTPSTNFTGTDSFTYKANDGNTDSNIAIVTITVVQPPLAPVVADAGGLLAYTEGMSPQVIDATLSITDADDTDIESATITISGGFVTTEDILAFANTTNINGSYNAASGVLTLTGTDTLANYEAALESITYTNSSTDNPNTGNRTVTWMVNDGDVNSVGVNSTITVAGQNDAPEMADAGGTLAYTEGDGARVIDAALTITDVDDTDIESATISLSAGFVSGEDILSFTNTTNISGNYNAASGVLTLTGTDTLANYEAALESVTYTNSNTDNPNSGNRTVTWQVNDGDTSSVGINSTITVAAQNDAPEMADAGSTLVYTEGDGAQVIDAALTITDVDDADIESATISLDTGFASGEDVLAFTNTTNISGSYNAATGVLTLTGTDTLVNYEAALESVTYTNSNTDNPNSGNRTVTWQVNDGDTSSVGVNSTITITPVNDPLAGNVSVDGLAIENQVLTANTAGITDDDGLGTFDYQWHRGGVDIVGATSSVYTLDDADVGAVITVQVNYIDAGGTAETTTSVATSVIGNINDAPAGSVLITGTAIEDQTLTADTSSLTDNDGLGAFSYQWQRDGVDIGGATGSTYTLDEADVGGVITVQVNYVDAGGTAETATSVATPAIGNINDAPAGSVLITGTAIEDQTLTADTSSLTDNDGLGAFSYQWQRDGADIGNATATSDTYTLDVADVGAVITVQVSYIDAGGTAETVTSVTTTAIGNVNHPPIGQGEQVTVDEDRQLTKNATNGVLQNDSDIDPDDVLTVTRVNNGTETSEPGVAIAGTSGGTFIINTDGSYNFDPLDDFQDLAVSEQRRTEVSYSIADGQGGEATVNLAVVVTGANDPITGVEDSGNTDSMTELTTPVETGILVNDADPDASDQLQVIEISNNTVAVVPGESITGDQGGVFVINANGTYSFNPGDDFHDLELGETRATRVQYTVTDGSGGSASVNLTVVVTGVDSGVEDIVLTIPEESDDQETPDQVAANDPSQDAETEDTTPDDTAESEQAPVEQSVVEEEQPGDVDDNGESEELGGLDIEDSRDFLFKDVGTAEIRLDISNNTIAASGFTIINNSENYENVAPALPSAERLRSEYVTFSDPSALISSPEFLRGLDGVRREVEIAIQTDQMSVGRGFALTTGLSVGYVVWIARSGVLLSSLLTSLPAWQFMDPLPMLSTMYARSEDDADDDSLESIIDNVEETELDQRSD